MKRISKKYFIILIVLFISIGFAYLTANLSLNASLSFKDNTWNIILENAEIGTSTVASPTAKINSDNESLTFGGTFSAPGDYIDIYFNVKNAGTLMASLSSVNLSLPEESQDYMTYTLTYEYDDAAVTNNDLLYAGQSRRIKVHLEYKYDILKFAPYENLEVTLKMSYIQAKSTNQSVWDYSYSGTEQLFYAPRSGTYKLEAWGASGGKGSSNYKKSSNRTDPIGEEVIGANGGYTSGTIELNKGETIYIIVGGAGKDGGTGHELNELIRPLGGYNGGGLGGRSYQRGAGGGGATDIRLSVNNGISSFESLKTRIMVAAGGSGASNYRNAVTGGPAGGLIGYDGVLNIDNVEHQLAKGGSQISGGLNGRQAEAGGFGFGGNSDLGHGSGGGSGYFGGGGGGIIDDGVSAGAGGSSFISGHKGCLAIDQSSTNDHIIQKSVDNNICTEDTDNIDCSIHYSNKVFTNTVMIDGNGYEWTTQKGTQVGMPDHKTNQKVNGNKGNGFARITFIN